MESKDIYNLLDNGWIYVEFSDPYFDRTFIANLPKKYVKRFDNFLFVRKSRKLYSILETMGMDLSKYDSTILIHLGRDSGEIKLDIYSLNNSDRLIDISRRIMEKKIF